MTCWWITLFPRCGKRVNSHGDSLFAPGVGIDAMFFDSHCHFDFAAFDEDREPLWQAYRQRGVRGLLGPGVAPAQWPAAGRLCGDYSGMIYGAGVHPWWEDELYAGGFDKAVLQTQLTAELEKPACRAVGEYGLDVRI